MIVTGGGREANLRHLRSLRESAIPHAVLDQPDTYRLHPLIRQVFDRILRNTLSGGELTGTYQAAAEYYRKQGAILEAIQSLINLPDYETALHVIDEDWHAVVVANGSTRVRMWLEAFPTELRRTPTFVKTMTQLLSLAGENRELVKYLADKLDPVQYQGSAATLGSLWIHYHWALLHLSPAANYNTTRREWQALKRRCGDFGKAVEAGVHVVLSLAAHQELREDKAIQHSRSCLPMLTDAQFDYRMTVLSNIALFTHYQGKSDQALAQFEEILSQCERKGAFTIVPMVLINMAEVYLSCGQYRSSLASAAGALQVLSTHNMVNRGVEMYADRCRGIAYWYLGEFEEGLKHLNSSYERSVKYDERERVATALWLDYFNLLKGKSKGTHILASSSLGVRTEQRLLSLGREAVQATMEGRLHSLKTAAAELQTMAKLVNSRGWSVTAHFLLTLWADASGKVVVAKKYLQAGLRELGLLGWSAYPMADDQISSFIIAKSARYGIGGKQARFLLQGDRRFDLAPAFSAELKSKSRNPTEIRNLFVSASQLQIRGLAQIAGDFVDHQSSVAAKAARRYLEKLPTFPLPPLHIRLLGGFSVTANCRSVTFGRKKSRQLLQLLLIERGRPVHEEVILEMLWPDSDPAKSKPILQTCVKDLRQSLDPYHSPKDKSYIVYSNEHYGLDLPEGSTIDIAEFEGLVDKAGFRGSAAATLSENQASILRSAIGMYRGDVLPEERFETYAIECRERIRQKFLDISIAVANRLLGQDRSAEAIAILERGFQFDPLWGEGVKVAMAARVKTGELYKAFQSYRSYEKRLHQELAVPPDQSLTAYFDELVASVTRS